MVHGKIYIFYDKYIYICFPIMNKWATSDPINIDVVKYMQAAHWSR